MSENINIDKILTQMASKNSISDIHIGAGEYIALRINGSIKKLESNPKITSEMAENMLKQLMKGNEKAYEKFVKDKEADFSYVGTDGTPYRVNAFYKLGEIGIVLRKIDSEAFDIGDLMFEDIADTVRNKVLNQRQGMFLVTGPTGSGKSTSLVAMIEHLNKNKDDHIITIEDPVEFMYEPKKALISQREIGHDSWAFVNALKAAMREDPDIVLVGEIRDKDTAEAALNLAETGHLVFSTLHTQSASKTINRYISFFPPEIQDSVADRLSETLVGVQSQRLVKKIGGGRIGLFELLINTSAVRNNIKKRKLRQIDNILETGIKQGMITLQQYTQRAIDEGQVDPDKVDWIFGND